jgi:type II secretory pathway component PulC
VSAGPIHPLDAGGAARTARLVRRCVLAAALAVAAVVILSCGGSQTAPSGTPRGGESERAAIPDAAPAPRASAEAPLPPRPGRLWRRDVVAALSRGLGNFLSRLQVEPALGAGKFIGWRVVELRANDPLWQGVDLAPGDVVTAVNGRPVERPEQAFAAFQSLAVAKELRVAYERAGARRELVYPIDDVENAP